MGLVPGTPSWAGGSRGILAANPKTLLPQLPWLCNLGGVGVALSPPPRGLLATGSQELYHHRPSKGLCTTTKRLCPSRRSLGIAMVTEGAWEEGVHRVWGEKGIPGRGHWCAQAKGVMAALPSCGPQLGSTAAPAVLWRSHQRISRTPWPLSRGGLSRPWLLSALSGFGPSLALSLRFLCSPLSSVGWGSEPGPS